MADVKGAGNLTYVGCLTYGPFEVKNLRYYTMGKTYARRPVEVLRPAGPTSDAIVRDLTPMRRYAYPVSGTRLEPVE